MESSKVQRRQTGFIRTFLLVLAALGSAAHADTVTVAVATNFIRPFETIATRFETGTGHQVRRVSGSTGALYAQVVHGAPFDILLAADAERPERLVREGRATLSRTYAVGRIVAWAPSGDSAEALLKSGAVHRLAIANPAVAPYGAAATEALKSLGVAELLAPRMVRGENIGQAYAMIASGNAELGIVALSQVLARPIASDYWLIPAHHHAPIRQKLALLTRGSQRSVANDFVNYILAEPSQATIRRSGYDTE